MQNIKDTFELISFIGTAITSIGIVVAVLQLYYMKKSFCHDHERSRREKAIDLVLSWVNYTSERGTASKNFVEQLNETDCNHIWKEQSFVVDIKYKNYLERNIEGFGECKVFKESGIDRIQISDIQSSVIRTNVCSYLNLTEMIFAAYYAKVADEFIIRREFSFLVSEEQNIHFLETFRKVAGGKISFPYTYSFVEELKKINLEERNKLGI